MGTNYFRTRSSGDTHVKHMHATFQASVLKFYTHTQRNIVLLLTCACGSNQSSYTSQH